MSDLISLKDQTKASENQEGPAIAETDRKDKPIAATDRKIKIEPGSKTKPTKAQEPQEEPIEVPDSPKTPEKSLEDLIKENEEFDAIFGECSTRALRGEKDTTLGTPRVNFDTCNVCQQKKPKTQPWIDHNISECHISALITQKGFGKAIKNLNSIAKFTRINCDLCGTWYPDPVTYQAHKNLPEHRLRESDILRWSKAARERKVARGTWTRIVKPEKLTPKLLSTGLKQLKNLK